MKVLFLTTGRFESIYQHGIYPDLLRTFMNNGHDVYIVSSREKTENKPTELIVEGNSKNLRVRIGNLTQVNLIEKGISTITIEREYKTAIKKYFSDVKFDLVMYSTPPITLASVVSYIKHRDGSRCYLMLKDIFPQNAVDLGMMAKSGVKGLIYKFFRKKEKQLYELSDNIGCMSQANVDYVIEQNPEIEPTRVEICPNSIEVVDMRINEEEKKALRIKYDLPLDKKIFLYGGNFGKPQGIDFIIECLNSQIENKEAYFLMVGSGTEFGKLKKFFSKNNPNNMKLLERLPKEDYDKMVSACDVGMIFLDYRFTIPNFPSRLLPILQAGIPVLCCTDKNTDIGNICSENNFGWSLKSESANEFNDIIKQILNSNLKEMGIKGYQYLIDNYSVIKSYEAIIKHNVNGGT